MKRFSDFRIESHPDYKITRQLNTQNNREKIINLKKLIEMNNKLYNKTRNIEYKKKANHFAEVLKYTENEKEERKKKFEPKIE